MGGNEAGGGRWEESLPKDATRTEKRKYEIVIEIEIGKVTGAS